MRVTATLPGADGDALAARRTLAGRWLDGVERLGNRCPDPILLFLIALAATWLLSLMLHGIELGLIDPRTSQPLQINNQLTLQAMATFIAGMTLTYVTFPPMGMVLIMVLGVGLAERSGLLAAALRGGLAIAPRRLLTPLVVLVSILAHVLSDSSLVVVLPLGAALFYVAGRHPLLGIVATFAPLSGMMFANVIPQSLDAILAGFTEGGARLIAPTYAATPTNNYWLMLATAVTAVPATWWMVDRVIAPRVATIAVDGDPALMPTAPPLSAGERRGLWAAAFAGLVVAGGLAWAAWPAVSPLRASDGSITGAGSPLMRGLTPLLLLLTATPALVYGRVAGALRTHREAIDGAGRRAGFRQPLHLYVCLAMAHASSASASAGRPVVARADAELLVRRDSPRRSGSTNGRTPTGTGATVRA